MLANWLKRGAILTGAIALVALGFVLGTAVISGTAADTPAASATLQIGVAQVLTEPDLHLAEQHTVAILDTGNARQCCGRLTVG